jgi:4'-phosphopantetheinyl transferase EntD
MNPAPAAVAAAVRRIFPPEVAVAVEGVGTADASDLWPEEQRAIAGAVPRRLAEFAAGRLAARKVLAALGLPAAALLMAADRAAVWPDGLSGSIAHDAGLAVAVARRGAPLGVDLEPDAPLDSGLWSTICLPEELDRLGDDKGRLVRQIFCAKEAVFKAQPATTRAMFGFDTLSVTLAEGVFDAQFVAGVGGFRSGQILSGRLAVVDGVILAGVAW